MRYLTLTLRIAVLLSIIGCTTMTPEEREAYEYRKQDRINQCVDFVSQCRRAGGLPITVDDTIWCGRYRAYCPDYVRKRRF